VAATSDPLPNRYLAGPGALSSRLAACSTDTYSVITRYVFGTESATRMSTKIIYGPVALLEKGDITASVFRAAVASEPAAPTGAYT